MPLILSLKKTTTASGEFAAIKEDLVKKTAVLVILILLSFAVNSNASWLVFHKPEYKGKVVDIETNEPIEGAVVVVIYRKLQMAIGDSVDMAIDAREALTNKSGEFTFPSYSTFINPLSSGNPVQFIIFKPGYACNGMLELEEEFSGNGTRPDRDNFTSWNHDLKYRILKAGVVMLPKVTGKDRIESFRNFYWGQDFKTKLQLASSIKLSENKYILTLE